MTNIVKLENWWLTGLVDSEGCFSLSISKDDARKTRYNANLTFEIALNCKDKALLNALSDWFGVKSRNLYYNKNDDTYKWSVSSLDEILNNIIPYFRAHPLITQKRADFEIFVKMAEIFRLKGHLSLDGLQELVNLKATMNLGLSDKLSLALPNTVAKPRPNIVVNNIWNPGWITGFTEGEGCFFVRLYKSSMSNLGLAVQLAFSITQDKRDMALLEAVKKYFKCGRAKKRDDSSLEGSADYIVNSFKDIEGIIMPHFEKYPLKGHKHLDLLDFQNVVEIMSTKGHLTQKGLDSIKNIKGSMNTSRYGDTAQAS